MNARRLLFRSWYYFRTGYSTYISFLLGVATTFVTVYYLAIDHIAPLKELFPNFWTFSLAGSIVGVVVCVLVGYSHLKRTQAYSAEVTVGVEANPYTRMSTPGKELKVSWPLNRMFIAFMRSTGKKLGTLTPEAEAELNRLDKMIGRLLDGESI